MKYLATIIIAIFLSSCIPLPAQNIISPTFSGNDLGAGIRYDRQFGRYGFYVSGGYGRYDSDVSGVIENVMAHAGVVKYVQNNRMDEWINYFSIGINGHHYRTIDEGYHPPAQSCYFPVSLELGVGCIITKRFNCGWTYDPIKKDAVISMGYRFGFRR